MEIDMSNEFRTSMFFVIPASVMYDDDLKANEKLLYGQIASLCNKEGYCWASNTYLAKLNQTSSRSICKWVNSLVRSNHLISKIDPSQANQRHIWVKDMVLWNKSSIPIEQKFHTPIEQKFHHNNKSNNNKNNNPPKVPPGGWSSFGDEILKKFKFHLEEFEHIPIPRKITKPRLAAIKSRAFNDDMFDLEDWGWYFYHISESSFLTKNCTASSFDWFLRPTVMQNIKEGKYHADNEGKYRPYEAEEEIENASM